MIRIDRDVSLQPKRCRLLSLSEKEKKRMHKGRDGSEKNESMRLCLFFFFRCFFVFRLFPPPTDWVSFKSSAIWYFYNRALSPLGCQSRTAFMQVKFPLQTLTNAWLLVPNSSKKSSNTQSTTRFLGSENRFALHSKVWRHSLIHFLNTSISKKSPNDRRTLINAQDGEIAVVKNPREKECINWTVLLSLSLAFKAVSEHYSVTLEKAVEILKSDPINYLELRRRKTSIITLSWMRQPITLKLLFFLIVPTQYTPTLLRQTPLIQTQTQESQHK